MAKTPATENEDYQRGFEAGRAERARYDKECRTKAQQDADAAWNSAFLASLPAAMLCQGWTFGGEPVRTVSDRMTLASEWADIAVKKLRP